MRECLFFPCMRNKREKIISTLQKKEYIMLFLQELVKETDNEIDDFVIEFVRQKLR